MAEPNNGGGDFTLRSKDYSSPSLQQPSALSHKEKSPGLCVQTSSTVPRDPNMPQTPTSPHTPAVAAPKISGERLSFSEDGGGSGSDNQNMPSPASSSGSHAHMSPGNSGSPDPVHALHPDLYAAGWRTFWSRREKRPYFFNKVTNQSLWEMPPMPNKTDLLTDPLGIGGPSAGPPPLHTQQSLPHRRPSGDAAPPPAKRRISEENPMMSPGKKINYNPFWNFDIPTNAIIYERKPSRLMSPYPEMEVLRAQLMAKLRQHYEELCHSRENIEPPPESFNRWLLERKLRDRGSDPMFPSSCSPDVSMSMYREIMNDIPVRLVRPKYSVDARRQLFKYAESAKRMIDTRSTVPESRKTVKWNVEDTISWLRKESNSTYEDYLERLAHLKRQCQPHLTEAAKPSVEGICSKLYHLSCEYVKKINEKQGALIKEHNIRVPDHLPDPARRKVMCYPTPLCILSPRCPGVDHITEGETTTLRYKGDALKINSSHFHKLEQLYRWSTRDDPRFEYFLMRAWCLLRRYQTMFGLKTNEGFGLQGALPLGVMECLHRVFGVTFECFASPLNCYFKQYCSAYPDTDCYFGSRGPVLDFYPISGSFEANPPFCEELMEAMVDHFENLLSDSQEPLSFIVFIPDWRDPPTEALIRLESSRFKTKQVTVPAYEHEYRHGFQHICPKHEDVSYTKRRATTVVFLQNQAGCDKWPPSAEAIHKLTDAFRPQSRAIVDDGHRGMDDKKWYKELFTHQQY